MCNFYEKQLILELCKVDMCDVEKLKVLLSRNLDYPYVLGQLLSNRLGGAAYITLKQNDLLCYLNREFRNSLEIVYEHNCLKENSFRQALDFLCEILNYCDQPFALLKGAYLLDVYESGVRTSNDVDILVEQKNISQIVERLSENGFKQGNVRSGKFIEANRYEILSSLINRGETVPFIKEINLPFLKYLEIDINFSMDYKPLDSNDNTVKEFLYNTELNIKTNNGYLPTLKKEFFLLHLCLHLFKEATVLNWVAMGRDVTLYKYMDIILYINEFFDNDFVNKFISIVKLFRLQRECYYVLFYTKKLFEINNINLDYVINSLVPNDTEYMNCVIDPQNHKKYMFDCDYVDWVFLNRKMDFLYEISNE